MYTYLPDSIRVWGEGVKQKQELKTFLPSPKQFELD